MKIITKNAKVFGVLLLIVTIIVVIGLAIRFFQIAGTKQVDGHNLTSATRAAFIQNQQDPATRGKIFDTNGKVLADNTTTYNLYAVLDKTQKQGNKPLYVVDKEETAEKLSRIINMKRSKIYKILSQKNLKQVEFGTAGKNLSIAVHKKIEDLKLSGISFTAQPARTYPNGRMASHLIGSVQSKENATTGQTKLSGLMGIEAAENSLLSGKDGIKSYAGTTADGQASEAAKNGDNVYLTLNSDLQNTLETKMDKLFSDTKPSGIVAVLAEAKTGRVLAASQRPNFDPNTKKGLQDEWQNLLTQGAFEPGSTMKGITLASAIETGNWQPNATFQSGTMLVDGKQINDFNKEMGVISYREGFWRSSNIAFAKTQQKMGANTWYKYLKKFKFLQSTNSGLLGEEKGSIAFNYPLEQANTAFGQGQGSADDMKSTSGYAFSLGSGMFSWASKKQATVAQSTAEAEYVAAAEATSQAIWLRRILEDMGEKQDKPTKINYDNKSAIAMAKNLVHHNRTKHITIKYHFIREAEATKGIKLDYCGIKDQIADIFTKT